MKLPASSIFVAFVMLLLATGTALAAPTSRPTRAVELAGCVTPDCHPNVKSSKQVHGPVAVNACDACHELTDAAKHTFSPPRQKADLCTYCHEFDVSRMPVVHKPVATGECLGCHDPHGGATHSLTREASVAELCGRCHDPITRGKKFLHGPVDAGACDSCHTPHASRFPKLVDVVGTDLCITCHTDFDAKLVRAKFPHKALDNGCEKCHDVHGSASPASTTQPAPLQCTGCHDPVKQRATHAKVKHSAVMNDRACLNCHTPHHADRPKLMVDVQAKTCLKCHDKEIKTANGKSIAAVAGVLDPNLAKHGAIKDGNCEGCHDAHGSDRAGLLTKANASGFYQKFAADQYALCFSCHDARLATAERIDGVTSFRDGDRNLHYAHVATAGPRSHSCRACHESHVAGNAQILREEVPYGIWMLPMNFRKTETGGTCTPGCHVPYAYDRAKPVGPVTQPAERVPTPTVVARLDSQPPRVIRFTAKDTERREVNVPAVDARTVIVSVNNSSDETHRMLASVGAAAAKQQVRLVVVQSGPAARPNAETLDDMPCPVIADVENKLADHLDVRAWPGAVLVDVDGTMLARVSGSAESLPVKLRAYLAVEAPPMSPPPTTMQVATEASRDAQVVVQLLTSGRALDAMKLVTDALKLAPDSTPLRVAQVKCLVALDRIEEAKRAAAALLATDPNAAEAHYQLGLIYEREGNFKRAAAEYRACEDARKR
jgi:predicted CXXCH cytochrome family protein